MFSLFNEYPLSTLLKKIRWNARAMFTAYAIFIGAGVAGAILAVNGMPDAYGFVMAVAMMAAALLAVIAPFLLYDYFRHKHDTQSLLMQDESSLELWDAKIRECEKIGGRIGVSDGFIFSACSTFYIPFFFSRDGITAIYSRRRRRKGRLIIDPNIYVLCQGDRLYTLPMGARLIRDKGGLAVGEGTRPLDEWVLSRMHAHMPRARIGILHARRLTKNPDAVAILDFDG